MQEVKEKLGLIGLGKWGRNYLNSVGSGTVSNVRISSLCAHSQETLASVKGEYVKTTDYRELTNHGLDGIIVASPSNVHFEMAAYLLRDGQNVLIEKPVTSTFLQARVLERIHQDSPEAVVMIGHIQIYDPGYQALKSSIDKIGPITEMIFKGLQSPTRTDSTVIENWGPHPIYLFDDLVGKEPSSLTARRTINDNVHLDIFYGPRITGRVDIGSVSDLKKRELTVIGRDGSLTLDWSGQKTLTLANNSDRVNIAFPTNTSPLELEIYEFVNCIRLKTLPRTPLTQGVEVMRILQAAQQSLSQNGVEIDLGPRKSPFKAN